MSRHRDRARVVVAPARDIARAWASPRARRRRTPRAIATTTRARARRRTRGYGCARTPRCAATRARPRRDATRRRDRDDAARARADDASRRGRATSARRPRARGTRRRGRDGGFERRATTDDARSSAQITARLIRELERARRRTRGEDVGEPAWRARASSGDAREEASTSGVGTTAAAPTRGLFAPADLWPPTRGVAGERRESIVEDAVRRRHPDVDDALRASARVGDLLLKREAGEIERARRFVDELDALERDPFDGAREPPCAVEAANVRACYGANAANVTACHDLVDEYKMCGRAALRKFAAREPAAA